jgi:hypothetical protein
MGIFELPALLLADMLARMRLRDEPAKTLFARIAAHSVLPLTHIASSALQPRNRMQPKRARKLKKGG